MKNKQLESKNKQNAVGGAQKVYTHTTLAHVSYMFATIILVDATPLAACYLPSSPSCQSPLVRRVETAFLTLHYRMAR